MPFLLIFYALLVGIVLSVVHSRRVLRAAAEPSATVNAILEARREKKILQISIFAAIGYLTAVLLSLLWTDIFYTWVVLTPFVYLSSWALTRYLPLKS